MREEEKTQEIAKLQARLEEQGAQHAKKMKALAAKYKNEIAARSALIEQQAFHKMLSAKPDQLVSMLPEKDSYVRVLSCTIPGYNIEAGEGWVRDVRFNNKGGLEFHVQIPVLNRTIWVPPNYIRCQHGKGDTSMLQVKLDPDEQSSSHGDCLSYSTPSKQHTGGESASRGKTKRPHLSQEELKRKLEKED